MKTLTPDESIAFKDIGILLLRIFLGLAMLFGHGIGKWTMLFESNDIKFADPFGIGVVPSLAMAVFAEVICALLLTIGLLTRLSVIPLIITMLVAAFSVHLLDGFSSMEKALLYGIGFLSILITGPGKYSVDALLKRKVNY